MKRGLLTGSLAEHELQRLGRSEAFTLDIGPVVDKLASKMNFGALGAEKCQDIRATAIRWVRAWQEGFPQDDLMLDLTAPIESLLTPQTDLFVRRPGRFAIRVRPDNVVGIGDTLGAWEWSTAQELTYISLARYALNHHALVRERRRRPEWGRYMNVVTRVEMLRHSTGFTIQLDESEAESWRIAIGTVADIMLDGQPERNQGPHCSTCPWQAPCWFAEDEDPQGF